MFQNTYCQIKEVTNIETYTVMKGDTLNFISYKTNVPIKEILKLNNIKDRDYLYVGQKLKIKNNLDLPFAKK